MSAPDLAINIVVAALLTVWLALTVAWQFHEKNAKRRARSHLSSFVARVKRRDAGGMIPTWTFFAPRPATADLAVVFRDVLHDGRTVTPWTDVMPMGRRRMWHFLWNPAKREKKALVDNVHALIRLIAVQPRPRSPQKGLHRRRLVPSHSYLALLNFVSRLPRSYAPRATQFAIMRCPNRVERVGVCPVMVSDVHWVDHSSNETLAVAHEAS